jgi:uncharacterized protein YciI
MSIHWHRLAACGLLAAGCLGTAAAQEPPPLPLWAVEIKTGTRWDAAKPPQEQPYFREHSQNLQRLRAAGQLVMGARYSDKGLVVLAAATEAEARAMMDADPAIQAETFRYELHAFTVFYGGSVATRPRPAAPAPAPASAPR